MLRLVKTLKYNIQSNFNNAISTHNNIIPKSRYKEIKPVQLCLSSQPVI